MSDTQEFEAMALAILDGSFVGSFSRDRDRDMVRLARILAARYATQPKRTFADIGAELGIGAERVRQLERKAVRLLAIPSRRQDALALASRSSDLQKVLTGRFLLQEKTSD